MNKREEFAREFGELLEKYGASIEADDHWEGYVECGRDIRMTVEFDDMDTVSIDLVSYVDSAHIKGRL